MDTPDTNPPVSPYEPGSFGDQNAQANEATIHPVVPPKSDPIQRAIDKYLKSQNETATPLRRFDTPNGYQNLDIILARLNRVEQMIEGASIGATCNATTSTIKVTLTWGS
jgi:hypothetical protein